MKNQKRRLPKFAPPTVLEWIRVVIDYRKLWWNFLLGLVLVAPSADNAAPPKTTIKPPTELKESAPRHDASLPVQISNRRSRYGIDVNRGRRTFGN